MTKSNHRIVPSQQLPFTIDVLGPVKQKFSAYNCYYCLIHPFKHVFWVLKRTASLRRFFWAPTTYVLGWEIRKIILSYALLSGGLDVLGKFIEMVHLNSWFIQYRCIGHCKKNSKNCFLSTADSLSQCLEQVHRIVFSRQQYQCLG